MRAPREQADGSLRHFPLRIEPASFSSTFASVEPEPSCSPWTLPLPAAGRTSQLFHPWNSPPYFPDLNSALSSVWGWLDLFSGSRGFAKALAAAAPCWVLCFDVCHAEDEDLLRPDLQALLLGLVSAGGQCRASLQLLFFSNHAGLEDPSTFAR